MRGHGFWERIGIRKISEKIVQEYLKLQQALDRASIEANLPAIPSHRTFQ